MEAIMQLEKTRNSDKFMEQLDQLLAADASAHGAVAELLPRLSGDRKWIAVVKCGEYGVREAVPHLRHIFAERGSGRDLREASMLALARILERAESIDVLIQALDDRDLVVAEDAAIEIDSRADHSAVPPLLDWIEDRLGRPRTKNQAHVTAEVIATSLRLGDTSQVQRLRVVLGGARLTQLEKLASDGTYRGQAASPHFPEISWPV